MKSISLSLALVSGILVAFCGPAVAQDAESKIAVDIDRCVERARAKNEADRKESVAMGMDPESVFLIFDESGERAFCRGKVERRCSTRRSVETPHMGKWSVRETTDPYGVLRVSAVLAADTTPSSNVRSNVLMACKDGKTEFVVRFGRFLDFNAEDGQLRVSVHSQIGAAQPVTADYGFADYGKGAVMTTDPEGFVASLHGETALSFAANERDGTSVTTRFQLDGVDAVVEKLADACNYTERLGN